MVVSTIIMILLCSYYYKFNYYLAVNWFYFHQITMKTLGGVVATVTYSDLKENRTGYVSTWGVMVHDHLLHLKITGINIVLSVSPSAPLEVPCQLVSGPLLHQWAYQAQFYQWNSHVELLNSCWSDDPKSSRSHDMTSSIGVYHHD